MLNDIHVEPNQQVSQGQPLAVLSSNELKVQLEQLAGRSEIGRKQYETSVQAAEYETGLLQRDC